MDDVLPDAQSDAVCRKFQVVDQLYIADIMINQLTSDKHFRGTLLTSCDRGERFIINYVNFTIYFI